MLGLVKGIVELHEHEAMWKENAAQTIIYLKEKFGEIAVDIQHIGSTAIEHIKAKPIIDIGVAVNDMTNVKKILPTLTEAGIIHRPHHDQPKYMMFIIGDLSIGVKTHHIHVELYDSKGWNNRINFRDFMNAHPDKAKEYEALKIKLMNLYYNNRDIYTDSKASYIESIFIQAAEWKRYIV
jgi:GrpB-like predicted nucleotidyltransferase (UPF0157 family)